MLSVLEGDPKDIREGRVLIRTILLHIHAPIRAHPRAHATRVIVIESDVDDRASAVLHVGDGSGRGRAVEGRTGRRAAIDVVRGGGAGEFGRAVCVERARGVGGIERCALRAADGGQVPAEDIVQKVGVATAARASHQHRAASGDPLSQDVLRPQVKERGRQHRRRAEDWRRDGRYGRRLR